MLSYMNDLTAEEQTKLDALVEEKDMTNKVILLVDEEFEIVNKEMFDKMIRELFTFEEDLDGDIVTDIYYCELFKQWASCATITFADNTVYHVDMHLAICIYNGEFDEIILDM